MPELPEVETTRRGLTPQVVGRRIVRAVVRNRALRWPVPAGLARTLAGLQVRGIGRRAKYLIIDCSAGSLIVHLGMSGRMRIVPAGTPAQKHDHLDLVLDNGMAVRLTDPRRFGAVLWVRGDPEQHKLLMNLGPEPLGDHFDARWLFQHTRGKTAAIKNVLMDSRVVAGVGNIYASEALFRAGINPKTAAGKLRLERCRKLTSEVKATLTDAIAAGDH